jgi:DNA-binding protein YbaB
VVTKDLEGKHADLEDEHTSLSREKDLVYDQVRKLKGLLRTINKEYEDSVKSHEMHASSLDEQISSLQEKMHDMDERLEEQEQKGMRASISVVVLEGSLLDVKDKNVALLENCQKYAVENHAAEILISQLEDQARYHEAESRALLKHNGKLREGISQHMKVLNISRDVGPAEIAQDEILLQTVSDETSNIVKLKEESEDINTLMYTELLVLATVMLQVGTEFRDLQVQKCALEKKAETEATQMISLQNENFQLMECNEQLRQDLLKKSEWGQVQKTEALLLHEKLSCLTESYHTLQDEIADMTERSESFCNEHNSLVERYKALEDEKCAVLAECMMLEHLSLFLRGHNNEVASALVSLTGEMALLSLAKGELDSKVKVLSARAMMLESENNNLKKYIVYLIEVLMTRLVLLEFELNTGKSVCQELVGELESCIAQLVRKDDKLLEAEENVQLMQEKNRELCRVIGALQVGIEGAKVVKGELEKKIMILTEEGATKDDEIFLLRQANETLQVDACILKKEEESLTSAHELMSKEVEQHERESALLVGDAITSSVNAALYEEKALKFMMEVKAIEISTIAPKELLLNKTSSLDAHIEVLQKKVNDMQEENAELRTKVGSRMEVNEIYSENEKQKDIRDSKGKQVQMMKDIELDQISTCPTYGTGIYQGGNVANAELDDEMLQLWEAAERTCKNKTAKSSSSEHDIQAVEEVKSGYPSSELVRGRELGINKLEMSSSSLVEPHDIWGKNVVERLASNAQRLLSIQESIEELKRKMGRPSKGRSPMNSEYDGISTQLHETEGLVSEQINLNSKLAKKAESYPTLSDNMNAEQEGLPSRRKISEQVKKGSDNVARLELELQKIQYVLLKLEEESDYKRLKVSDKRTRVLLRDYLYGRKDHRGGARKKKAPFCGCVPSKSRTEP